MWSLVWDCMLRQIGGFWMWILGFAIIVAIIVGLSTLNPWAGLAAAGIVLALWLLVVFLNCLFRFFPR